MYKNYMICMLLVTFILSFCVVVVDDGGRFKPDEGNRMHRLVSEEDSPQSVS